MFGDRKVEEYVLYNNAVVQTVTSSTDATPIVVTKAAHGFSTGDQVVIFGHTTNIAANGIYKIIVLTANTFALYDFETSAPIAGSGGGAGAGGIMAPAPKVVQVDRFTNIMLQVSPLTANTGMTLKVVGSLGKISEGSAATTSFASPILAASNDRPNFAGTQGMLNPWSYLSIQDVDANVSIAGSTGIILPFTPVNNMFKVNGFKVKYLTVIPTAFAGGRVSVKMLCGDNL